MAAAAFPVGSPVRAVVVIAWHDDRELDDAAPAAATRRRRRPAAGLPEAEPLTTGRATPR